MLKKDYTSEHLDYFIEEIRSTFSEKDSKTLEAKFRYSFNSLKDDDNFDPYKLLEEYQGQYPVVDHGCGEIGGFNEDIFCRTFNFVHNLFR